MTIYAGASILGGETVIGTGTVVGSNAFIVSSVGPHMKIQGKPQEPRCHESEQVDRHLP